jgi:hypothetical protein
MQVMPWAPVIGVLAVLGSARATVTEQNFLVRNTGDLVALCSASQSDPLYTAAVNFCHGFAVGVFRVVAEEDAARQSGKVICLPNPPPSRNQALAAFVRGPMPIPAACHSLRMTGSLGTSHSNTRAPGGAETERYTNEADPNCAGLHRHLGWMREHDPGTAARVGGDCDRSYRWRYHRCDGRECRAGHRYWCGGRPRGRPHLQQSQTAPAGCVSAGLCRRTGIPTTVSFSAALPTIAKEDGRS